MRYVPAAREKEFISYRNEAKRSYKLFVIKWGDIHMISIKKKDNTDMHDLTDKDFYQQACEYFYYHAEQRTTMINYFIAVFGAGIALYGNVIGSNPVAGLLISAFLLAISILFCSIDLRNKFDVKHSQNVITQIEHDYGMDLLKTKDAEYVYGVFSNEDNTFKYYGREHRKEDCGKDYKKLRKLQSRIKWLKRLKVSKKYINRLENQLKSDAKAYLNDDKTISYNEFMKSLKERSIRSLSKSIKLMYYLCMVASIGGMCWAAWDAGYVRLIINLFVKCFS